MPGENKLLVIGINEYTCVRHPRLHNAVDDAGRFGNILTNRYGFIHAEESLFNEQATGKNIVAALTNLTVGLTEEDTVIIYYAGHGFYNSMTEIAYWVPQNANFDPYEYLPHSTIIDYVKGMKCQHVLLISDSCFSGAFAKVTRTIEHLTPEELAAMNSRWMFASGGIETVPDGDSGKGSHFCNVLCEVLEKNTAPVLSANHVFERVIREVDAADRQSPDAWQIKCPMNEGGQLLFRLQTGAASIVPVEPIIATLILPLPIFSPLDYYISRQVLDIENQPDPTSYFFQPDKGRSYLADLVQTEKRIIILGSAGSGKSIELQQLIDTLRARDSAFIPGFKRFNTYIDQPIEALMPKGFKDIDPARALVLLDGLDEVPPQHFQTALRRIQQFTEDYPNATVVITCRSNFYELPQKTFSGTIPGFRVFSLLDLSPRDVVRAITDQYGQNGELFLQQVVQYNLRDLVTKPFFLAILIKRFLKYGNLSGKRIDIMEEALLAYQSINKEHYNTTIKQLPQPEIIRRLSKLAFVMEISGKNYLTDEELFEVMGSQQLVDDCHYLPAFSLDPESDHWMFAHNNLQEYLVARELVTKPASRILEQVTTSKTGAPKVKPTWVNTLSFLVSIAPDELNRDLLKWITAYDQEILIRFEPDRLTTGQREQLFIDIFNFYSDKELWLVSNKFSDAELARFGQSEKTLEFLLQTLISEKSGVMRKMNAVRVIDNFAIQSYQGADTKARSALMALLDDPEFSYPNVYRVVAAIAGLGLADESTVAAIVSRYQKNKHQYIRASLYLLLSHSNVLDQYVSVLIDGLSIGRMEEAEGERDEVRLMDESVHLEAALQKIKSPEAIKTLLAALTQERYHAYFYFADLHEVLEGLMENAAAAYKNDPSILPAVVDLYLSTLRHHSKQQAIRIKKFIDLTQTHWQAFRLIWKLPLEHFEERDAVGKLTSDATVDAFAEAFHNRTLTTDDLVHFHQLIFWNDVSSEESMRWLALLETAAAAKGITLERPVLRDWGERRKKQSQDAFDLLFDTSAMLTEVSRIFTTEGKTSITREEWFGLHSKNVNWEGTDYVTSAMDLIRQNMRSTGNCTVAELENQVNDPKFRNYQAKTIFQDLSGSSKTDLVVSETQKKWIEQWSTEMGYPGEILWFFLNRFELDLPLDKLLSFTNYYHFGENAELTQEGYLEALHKFIDPAKVKERVLQNLNAGIIEEVIWTSHAAYALRQRLTAAYPGILDRLTKATRTEYKYGDVLELWYESTRDHQFLKQFIQEATDGGLRWKAVNLLQKSGVDNDFLTNCLSTWMNDGTEDLSDRYFAANHLIALGQLSGFTFIATEFLKAPTPDIEFRRKFYNLPVVKDAQAVDLLMQLLYYGKQPEYKKDHFDDLETLVLDALYQIGTQSPENFQQVRTALLSFMETNRDKLPNLQFLEYRITSMEDQLNLQSSKNYSISEALTEFDRLHR